MSTKGTLCIYSHMTDDGKVRGKVYGRLFKNAIDFVKANLLSLKDADDTSISFSYGGTVVPDEEEVWRLVMEHARPPLGVSRIAEISVGLVPGGALRSREEPGHVCAEGKQGEQVPTALKKGTKAPIPSYASLRSSSSASSSGRKVKPDSTFFTITVEYGAEEGMKFAVLPHQRLGELKAAFEHNLGVEPDHYRLVFDGSVCSDENTFSQMRLEDGSVIDATVKQKGGKPVIYVYPPQPMDVACRLSLTRDWSFSAVYPQVEEKLLPDGGQSVLWRARVEKNGDMKMLGGLPSDGNAEEGLEVSYLYWEALTNSTRPCSPPSSPPLLPASSTNTTPPFNPSTASLSHHDTIFLPISQVTSYLDKALKALGLHVEGRTSFITYWLPSFLKHTHLLLRFVPQDSYSQAAPLELTPPADVTTRIFLLFEGLSAEAAQEDAWSAARSGGDKKDFESWREVVGVASRERQEDASLLRVVEWGGMEVLSR